MKLISLYIENFGGLSRYALDFEAGITTLVQPNGFGKTTLAEFIRAMLYGFPRKNKTLDKSLRQKYTPWNGGQFGGTLVFEQQSRRYRVERTFGENPRSDTFTLIDLETNRKSDRFSEELGRELFGLDADSFARSTYLPQIQEEGPLATASIQAKLTELVEDGSDVANFDKAVAALKAKRSTFIPYRGNGGTVAETAGRITQLQLRLELALQQQEQYLQLQQETVQTETELTRHQEELSALQQDIADAAFATEAVLRQEQYANLNSRYREAAAQEERLQKAYPAGFPDLQSLRSAELAADRLAVLNGQSVTTPADLQAQQTVKETGPLPTAEQIDRCRKNCETYESLQRRFHAAEQTRSQTAKRRRKTVVAACLLLVPAVAAGAAGIWLLTQRVMYGIAAVGAGGIAMLIALVLLLRRHPHDGSESSAQLQQQLDACATQIGAFFAPYFGAVGPEHFLSALTRLEHKMAARAQAQVQLRDWQQREEARSAELAACRRELTAFFDRYQIELGDDPRERLYRLRFDLHDARGILSRKRQLEEELEVFRQQHGQFLLADVTSTETPDALRERERMLRSTLTALQNSLLQQKQQMQQLRRQTDEIAPMREELEVLHRKLTEDRQAAAVLDATVEFLQQARENLSTAYLGTIRARFAYYLSQLDGDTEEAFFIDPEFQLQLERAGKARELAYFSAGQTDLLMLCMRLALVDALFKEEEVFVVLDDPFVNLDDAHLAQALDLLQKLAQRRQILYLTCHSSRTVTGN